MNIYKLGWSCINQKHMKFWFIFTGLRSMNNGLKFFFWNLSFSSPTFQFLKKSSLSDFISCDKIDQRSIHFPLSNRSLIIDYLTRPRIPWERNVNRRHDSTRFANELSPVVTIANELLTPCLHRCDIPFPSSFTAYYFTSPRVTSRETLLSRCRTNSNFAMKFPEETLCFYHWENRRGLKGSSYDFRDSFDN